MPQYYRRRVIDAPARPVTVNPRSMQTKYTRCRETYNSVVLSKLKLIVAKASERKEARKP